VPSKRREREFVNYKQTLKGYTKFFRQKKTMSDLRRETIGVTYIKG
jgi:hypothetical protein